MSDHNQNSTKNQVKKNKADLVEEKERLGFGDVSNEEFLGIQPDVNADQSDVSKIIDLQNQLKQAQKKEVLIFWQFLREFRWCLLYPSWCVVA